MIDVLALPQPSHRGHRIVGIIREGRVFGASAALSDATLVVAEHDVSAVGELARELGEDGNACDDLVAVGRSGSTDEDDGWVAQAPCNGWRHRDRAHQVEAVRGYRDRRVGRVVHRLRPHRDAGRIVPNDLQSHQWHVDANEPRTIVDGD